MAADLLTVREAAELANCSTRIIYRALDMNELPGYKLSPRNTRIAATDLREWITRRQYHDQ